MHVIFFICVSLSSVYAFCADVDDALYDLRSLHTLSGSLESASSDSVAQCFDQAVDAVSSKSVKIASTCFDAINHELNAVLSDELCKSLNVEDKANYGASDRWDIISHGLQEQQLHNVQQAQADEYAAVLADKAKICEQECQVMLDRATQEVQSSSINALQQQSTTFFDDQSQRLTQHSEELFQETAQAMEDLTKESLDLIQKPLASQVHVEAAGSSSVASLYVAMQNYIHNIKQWFVEHVDLNPPCDEIEKFPTLAENVKAARETIGDGIEKGSVLVSGVVEKPIGIISNAVDGACDSLKKSALAIHEYVKSCDTESEDSAKPLTDDNNYLGQSVAGSKIVQGLKAEIAEVAEISVDAGLSQSENMIPLASIDDTLTDLKSDILEFEISQDPLQEVMLEHNQKELKKLNPLMDSTLSDGTWSNKQIGVAIGVTVVVAYAYYKGYFHACARYIKNKCYKFKK